MRRFIPAATLAAILALAGCGGTGHRVVAPATHAKAKAAAPFIEIPAQCRPATNAGHLGVCVRQPASPLARVASASRAPTLLGVGSGGRIYDLYVGNWSGCSAPLSQARVAGLVGVIVKAYENRPDLCFATYWHELQALGIWHAAYVFAHCCWQVPGFVDTINRAGGLDAHAGPPIVDEEVSDGYGAMAAYAPALEAAFHVSTIIGYSAPGTWPGGDAANAQEWIATYGSGYGCIWTCHPVAWQYTDGTWGPAPHCVGQFCGDLSLDFGITSILAHPAPPPDPYRIFLDSSLRLAGRTVNEYLAVQRWDSNGCANPVKRSLCGDLRYDLELAGQRILYLVHHGHRKPYDWAYAGRGRRLHDIVLRIFLTGRHSTAKDI